MQREDWLRLKSGTDVRGTALEGVAGENVDLTDQAVEGIVKAFYFRLAETSGKDKLTIAVGHDSRLSANRIAECVLRAIAESGGTALFTGLSSTPSMFMLLQDAQYGADASIMITASHLPYNKNGLKFFLPDGGLEGKDISDILALAAEGAHKSGSGCRKDVSFMDKYAAGLVALVREKTGKDRPLAGKKIVVDAGNGAGGFYAEKVLAAGLPCRISFSSAPAAGEGSAAAVGQTVKLFVQPEVEIPPGSRIAVTRGEKTVLYARSGEPARYPGHQEVNLALWERWA